MRLIAAEAVAAAVAAAVSCDAAGEGEEGGSDPWLLNLRKLVDVVVMLPVIGGLTGDSLPRTFP